MKKITRRQFLTSAGATSAALLLSSLPHAAAADENCLRKVTPAATNSNGLSWDMAEEILTHISDPVFPAYTVNVLDYGAVPNDGKLDTAAIQRAIDETSAHGGGWLPRRLCADITDCLRRGGAVVVRLYLLDDPHYILLTGVQGEKLCAFDPYLPEEPLPEKDIVMTDDHPYAYNRVIPFSYFNHTGRTQYALGETARREAVLLFNTHTELTEEQTVEYVI